MLCWFWSTAIKLAMAVQELLAKNSTTETVGQQSSEARRRVIVQRLQLTIVKLVCYTLLAMSFLPAKGVKLLGDSPSGPLAPLHSLLAVMAPPQLAVSDTVRCARHRRLGA